MTYHIIFRKTTQQKVSSHRENSVFSKNIRTTFSQGGGFTLIELLVVIAIIGIMASLVLASLGDTREDARNAKIQAMSNDLRTQIEVFYNRNGTYSGFVTDSDISDYRNEIQALGPNGALTEEFGWVADGGHKWVWGVKMVGDRGYWCIDSNGFAGEIASRPASGSETCQ